MAQITETRGDLLQADVEALVNTVNSVGVMGKGIALQFRKAFPVNYELYRRACDAGDVEPGQMFVTETGQMTNPRLIINFPTKRHWKSASRIEDIESGLVDLVKVLKHNQVRSIAIPALGCGNGGLDWNVVRQRINKTLEPLENLDVTLFGVDGAPDLKRQVVGTPRPRMTEGRAALIAALAVYKSDPTSRITQLVAQKIAYFLQVAGQPLKLDFEKDRYGPYAETLNHVLHRMDGHFITGCGDRSTLADIELVPDAAEEARSFTASDQALHDRVGRVQQLIEGFESPFGLELLSTVHWVNHNDEACSADAAADAVASWNTRKRQNFPLHHVEAAWERLERDGWLTN